MASLGIILLLSVSLQFIYGLNLPQSPNNLKEKKARILPDNISLTSDSTQKTHNDHFPNVEYPSNIFDVTKFSIAADPMVDESATNPSFDRSVSPEMFAERTRKKLNTRNNAALKNLPSFSRVDEIREPLSDKKTDNKPSLVPKEYLNNRMMAKKLALIAKQPKYSEVLSIQGTQLKNSSKWSKDIPVIQVVEDAISIVEQMMKNSSLSYSEPSDKPTISGAEAKKLITILDNISEILDILNGLQDLQDSLYYNIKTGVIAKPLNAVDNITPEPILNSAVTSLSKGVTLEPEIPIVKEALSIVGDLKHSDILQTINKESNNKNDNPVILTKQEAEEMVNVGGTVKDILSVLGQLNSMTSSLSGLTNLNINPKKPK